MELIIDSSNIEAIRQLNELLTITGITTNPTIITKSGKDPKILTAHAYKHEESHDLCKYNSAIINFTIIARNCKTHTRTTDINSKGSL